MERGACESGRKVSFVRLEPLGSREALAGRPGRVRSGSGLRAAIFVVVTRSEYLETAQ